MKRQFYLTLFLMMFLLSLISCKGNRNVKDNSSINKSEESEKVKILDESSTYKVELNPDYNESSCVFDRLSEDSMKYFVNKYRETIGGTLLYYYDDYSEVNELDSIFKIMASCRFSEKIDKELVSFYIHVLFETLKNENVDGYVKEYEIDLCLSLMNNYPGCFYQHISNTSKRLKKKLAENIAVAFYFHDIDENEMSLIFEEHKRIFPQYDQVVSSFYNEVKHNVGNVP